MLDRTGDPVSRTIPRLVGSLTSHLRRARAAHRLEAQGLSSSEAASRLGIKPYPAQKLYGQIRNYSAAELDAALVRLAQLDHALKGGSRLANELELERALVEITQPRAA
jgi:DNA polymerase III delta subunit